MASGKKWHRKEVSPSDESGRKRGRKRSRGDTSSSAAAGKKRKREESSSGRSSSSSSDASGKKRGGDKASSTGEKVQRLLKRKDDLKAKLKKAEEEIARLKETNKTLRKERSHERDIDREHELYSTYGDYAVQFQKLAASSSSHVSWRSFRKDLKLERRLYREKKWDKPAHKNLSKFLEDNGFTQGDWEACVRFLKKRNVDCHSNPPKDQAAREKLKRDLSSYEEFLGEGEEEVLIKIITLDGQRQFFYRRYRD